MLKHIEYTVTFSTTGRTLRESINFKTGFGTITGANEAGKSFVIEMARWALFGTAALRGKASEMKKAKVKLDFLLKGEDYRVERTTTNAKLFRGDIEIAIGTTPVNNKVAALFGFGLDVFDTACVAKQGEIEALGAMRPAERKRLVDSVIGLGAIDDLAKSAGEEANSIKRMAKDLADRTPEPMTPARPEDYRDLAEVTAELAAMSKAKERIAEISGLVFKAVAEPVAPEELVQVPSEQLRDLAEKQEQNETKLRKAKLDLSVVPQASKFMNAELDAMEKAHDQFAAFKRRADVVRRNPVPSATVDELKKDLEQLAENTRANRLKDAKAKLASKSHTCPACTHTWAPDAEALEAEIAALDGATHRNVLLTPSQITQMLQDWKAYEAAQTLLASMPVVDEVPEPELSLDMIEVHRKRNSFKHERATLEKIIEETPVGGPDFVGQLKVRVKYEEQMQGFAERQMAYAEWMQERQTLLNEQTVLRAEIEGFDELKSLADAIRLYDSLMLNYADNLKVYTEQMLSAQEMMKAAAEWDKAKVALTNLRSLVKQHLMPSLNKVASFYLQQMTGGQRQVVFADDEFNISVDGQDINTLSGSGKAVAGLALRLGLGQVLTNGVFSLFVGDEIDASMDKDRAENTANTLQTLKSKVSQILLITHKFPTADYYITVGKTHEPEEDDS